MSLYRKLKCHGVGWRGWRKVATVADGPPEMLRALSLSSGDRDGDLCVFSYASERGDASSRFLLPPLAAFIHRRHIRISRRNRDSEKYIARRMSHRSIFLFPYSTLPYKYNALTKKFNFCIFLDYIII